MVIAKKIEPVKIEWGKEPTSEERLARRRALCDHYATEHAKNTGCKRQWGRWYTPGGYLITAQLSEYDELFGHYEIPIDDIEFRWLAHMLWTKDWIGVSGLRDLADAIDELRRE